MCQYLDNQMSEKRHRYDAELEGNKMYMNEWNAKMETAGQEAKDKTQALKDKKIANQRYLRQQIDDKAGTNVGSPHPHVIRKMVMGGQMNADEVKMNR